MDKGYFSAESAVSQPTYKGGDTNDGCSPDTLPDIVNLTATTFLSSKEHSCPSCTQNREKLPLREQKSHGSTRLLERGIVLAIVVSVCTAPWPERSATLDSTLWRRSLGKGPHAVKQGRHGLLNNTTRDASLTVPPLCAFEVSRAKRHRWLRIQGACTRSSQSSLPWRTEARHTARVASTSIPSSEGRRAAGQARGQAPRSVHPPKLRGGGTINGQGQGTIGEGPMMAAGIQTMTLC